MKQIRTANKSDVDNLIELFRSTIDRNKRSLRRYFERYIVKGRCRVIDNVNVVAGYVYYINRMPHPYEKKFTRQRYVWLDQVMVVPEMQGYGYGRALMEDFLVIPADEYRLVCKPRLIKFYETFEFSVVVEIVHQGDVNVIMNKIPKSI